MMAFLAQRCILYTVVMLARQNLLLSFRKKQEYQQGLSLVYPSIYLHLKKDSETNARHFDLCTSIKGDIL